MNLNGQKIIVTGGSRGIGAGIVESLAKAGASVAFSYSSNEASARTLLEKLPGNGHSTFALNIQSTDQIETSFEQAIEKLGGITGLVNNAGITKDQLLLRMKPEDIDSVLNTNLRGAIWCSKSVLKPMIKARAGSIVNISSVVAQMGNPGQTNYVASKAGLEGFTRAMALEVASRNIRVNAVAPGFIQTDMTEVLDSKQKEAISNKIPLGKMGSIDDIAHAVVYFLSNESSYVTGQILQVNGGLYM